MGVYYASKDPHLKCPLCAKYVHSSKKFRHGKGCFYIKKLAGAIYSWYQFDGKYICMVCAEQFRECKQLTTHLLVHDASDLQVLGFERFMLAKLSPD